MKKTIVPVVITAALTSLGTLYGVNKFSGEAIFPATSSKNNIPVHYVSNSGAPATQPVDFSPAAEAAVRAVVHVKTLTQGRTVMSDPYSDPFSMLFGPRQYRIPDQMGAGSGVIISADGYILTNNHVIQGADEVQVTFNDRNTQIAKVVGADPATDLAILKIDGNDLPYITLGNSDEVKLGQWVLAVGYPLNLDATVTAGIVSAKGRSLGINQRNNRSAIESFIQTDAAVNPGNSGGALVNTQGQLIGINTAIASPTGSYAGYSYAVPSNLAQKVANDIIKFGTVKRGYIGAELADFSKMDEKTALSLGISKEDYHNASGVFVANVRPGSGAAAAGLQKGDIITAINATAVSNPSQLQEQVARYHPGDKISLSYLRGGKSYTTTVELKNESAISSLAGNGNFHLLGANFKELSAQDRRQLGVQGGVVVTEIDKNGVLGRQTNIQKGFVITSVNDEPVKNIRDLQNLIAQSRNIQLGGLYPGKRGMYYYGLSNIEEGY
jgi:serine protease Do